MKELELNIRVQKKIEESTLEIPIKELLKSLLTLEINEGKIGNRYTEEYRKRIENSYIILKRSGLYD
jgi:hypothetical protein